MSAPIDLVRRAPLLADLQVARLEEIAGLTVRKNVARGNAVVRQGEPGGAMFIIASGYVKVVRSNQDGRDSTLNVMGPGEVFGEVTLLDGGPRTATIIALSNAELLSIGRGPFTQFLQTSPETSVKLLSVLASRMRNITERADDVAFLRVGGRLARALARLAERYGERRMDGSIRLPFRLSQQELGDLVDITRESTNKQLRKWTQLGLVTQQAGHFIVYDLGALKDHKDD